MIKIIKKKLINTVNDSMTNVRVLVDVIYFSIRIATLIIERVRGKVINYICFYLKPKRRYKSVRIYTVPVQN